MKVYVLLREDQDAHGYVDTSIAGVFQDEEAARVCEQAQRRKAEAEGSIVESDDSPDGEWQVSWLIQDHEVR